MYFQFGGYKPEAEVNSMILILSLFVCFFVFFLHRHFNKITGLQEQDYCALNANVLAV